MVAKVSVVAHGGVSRDERGRAPARVVGVEVGTMVADVLLAAGVDCGLVGVSVSNGKIVELDAVVEEDCAIEVFPLVGGG